MTRRRRTGPGLLTGELRGQPRAPLNIDAAEGLFLGSPYFPVRATPPDLLHLTSDGVILAALRLVDGQPVVERIGTGRAADAHVARVTRLLVQRGAIPHGGQVAAADTGHETKRGAP